MGVTVQPGADPLSRRPLLDQPSDAESHWYLGGISAPATAGQFVQAGITVPETSKILVRIEWLAVTMNAFPCRMVYGKAPSGLFTLSRTGFLCNPRRRNAWETPSAAQVIAGNNAAAPPWGLTSTLVIHDWDNSGEPRFLHMFNRNMLLWPGDTLIFGPVASTGLAASFTAHWTEENTPDER